MQILQPEVWATIPHVNSRLNDVPMDRAGERGRRLTEIAQAQRRRIAQISVHDCSSVAHHQLQYLRE